MGHKGVAGIHHVTAVGDDPQRTLDFYAGVLGLRLVKLTVNFDDPGAYHFYFGDETGAPGTILTFFLWPGAPRGRLGTGQAGAVAFSIPADSLGYWTDRLRGFAVSAGTTRGLLGEEVLSLSGPDGLPLELVAEPRGDPRPPRENGPIPSGRAIRGLHGVALHETGGDGTEDFLTGVLGFRERERGASRARFEGVGGGPGAYVDLVRHPWERAGRIGAGTVHHVAWRAPGKDDQESFRKVIARRGIAVTEVIDRRYFLSIYFREPGGALFEIATDRPGFTRDEPLSRLGTRLMLPPWLDVDRERIERILPPIRLPEAA